MLRDCTRRIPIPALGSPLPPGVKNVVIWHLGRKICIENIYLKSIKKKLFLLWLSYVTSSKTWLANIKTFSTPACHPLVGPAQPLRGAPAPPCRLLRLRPLLDPHHRPGLQCHKRDSYGERIALAKFS